MDENGHESIPSGDDGSMIESVQPGESIPTDKGRSGNFEDLFYGNRMTVGHLGHFFQNVKSWRFKLVFVLFVSVFIAIILIILLVFGLLRYFSPSHRTDSAQSVASEYVSTT